MSSTRIERLAAGAAAEPMSPEQQRELRWMMGRFATGVTVVAARQGPFLSGMTANAIASISIDPPMMMASIGRRSETHTAIVGSHSFAISVLSAAQRELAECFAQPVSATKLQRFCDAPWHEAETGSPILEGAIAYFDCRLTQRYDGGDHSMFLGEVVAAGFDEQAEPLIFFAGDYRLLQAADTEQG